MAFSPQSQSIVDRLLSGRRITSGTTAVGPFDESGKILLGVVCENYDEFQNRSGDDRARFLLRSYREAKEVSEEQSSASDVKEASEESLPGIEKPAQPKSVAESHEPASRRNYLLNHVQCTSFRGIAPAGETVSFEFGTKSNLIVGPNGSGKSSLLGAVGWVLTGRAVSDAHEESETAPVHNIPTSDGKGSKITDWPIVATLPDTTITKETVKECSASIELVAQDSRASLYLRRSITDGLEFSWDGQNWSTCDAIDELGIQALDLQLSVTAPTTFGKFTVESAPDTKRLLSLMLGYDDLENLGELASNMSSNRTRLANREQDTIDKAWSDLTQRLKQLPTRLDSTHEVRTVLDSLASSAKPSNDQIKKASQKTSGFIQAAEKRLAEIIGLETEKAEAPVNLAEKLTGAVLALEKGIWESFPLLCQLRLEDVLPCNQGESSEAQLEVCANQLDDFLARAVGRIAKRLDWWRSETAPGSKATLLLHAAQYFEPAAPACPVCERSIKDLPVKDELMRLKTVDPELQENTKNFFRNLCSELNEVMPNRVRNLAVQSPQKRILDDWEKLTSRTLPSEFLPLIAKFGPQIEKIADGITIDRPVAFEALAEGVEDEFAACAKEFQREVENARTAIETLKWSQSKLGETERALHSAVTATSEQNKDSLLASLSVGKEAAAVVAPLKSAREELDWANSKREEIKKTEIDLTLLEELRSPLDDLKAVKKYAETEVRSVFADIQDSTLENWKILYPETSSGLAPARLVVGSGRDRSVIALLSKGHYEVPEQFFGNAGLQRAVALSFYFALLQKHPGGLGFAIMDDPILSLDDGHRESWSRKILKPWMGQLQFIVATHQAHYLTNCRSDFADGQIVELNPRRRRSRISWRPGDRLDRAAEELERAPSNAPTEMRKYREDLLYTLDAYSPAPFFNPNDLTGSLTEYSRFPESHPLAGSARTKILQTLRDSQVTSVLDPGSHALTEADVTAEMIQTCLRVLRERDGTVRSEFDRLERLRRHSQRHTAISSSLVPFVQIPDEACWDESIQVVEYGRAAAREESWVVDVADDPSVMFLRAGNAVLVAADTLDPVAKRGQWVLLAHEEVSCKDGDLVSASCVSGDRLLRRIWSSGENWTLQSINPVEPVADVTVPKTEVMPRKIVGVLYEPRRTIGVCCDVTITEWQPRSDFQVAWFSNFAAVIVEGRSLDPIARAGQKVLIDKEPASDYRTVKNGDLAVIETNVDSIGRVIKRVYRMQDNCVLISPNPVERHPPELLNRQQLSRAKFWGVQGVLFESAEE